EAAEGGDGVRVEAPEHAGVLGAVQGADLHDHRYQAAQGGGERRDTGVPVAGVGDDDDVGGEEVGVLLEEVRQVRRADLLLSFDEDLDADPGVAFEGADGAEMHDYAGLVVAGPSPIEPSAGLERVERAG